MLPFSFFPKAMIFSPLFRQGLLLAILLGFGAETLVPLAAQTPPANGFSNYQNTPVNSILDIYEQLSGKHLIRDANLTGIPPISINATGLGKAEMLKLIEATLLLNGVAIVQVDDQTVKIVASATKSPRSEGVRLYANSADFPVDDQVISYYMPLSYISPQEAGDIFSKSVPPHPYGIYVPAPSAQALILTENESVIRQLIALKELVDVPPAPVTSEFVQLRHADAEKVADLLTKLLDPKTAAASATPTGAVIVPADLGTTSPLLNEHNLLSGPAQIVADTRSNRLLIFTRPVNMPFLKQLIAQLDQTDVFMVPQRRPLKYVLAQDILPALEAALAQGKDEEDQIRKDTPGSVPPTAAAAQPVAQATTTSGTSSNGGQSVSSITPSLPTPTQNNVPTVVTIGKTRLLADNRSNSIIVFGSPDVVSRVFDMVDQLDRKPLQVYLATVIGELTVSEGEEFGIDILQKFQKIGQGGLASSLVTPGSATSAAAANNSATGVTTPSLVPNPNSLTSSLGFPLPAGLTLYGAIGSTLNAYVRALETTNRFKVISRPSVYTTNNKKAVIASGSQIPVPGTTVSGLNNDNNLTSSSSTVYESVLLELEIIPLINANHEVSLQIRQTNNTQGNSQIISGNAVPTILTQEINTEVTVPDKATIVIGGLISDNTTRKTSGVPWLSDIPVLGYLFKDTAKNKERDELIIMIQPTVVETDIDQINSNETEKKRTILGREALAAATGFSEDAPVVVVPKTPGATTTVNKTTTTTYNSKAGRPDQKTESTTVTVKVPNSTTPTGAISTPGLVPAASSPAPDVDNGRLPKDAPAPPPNP